ncbi:hypothetical protein [Pseudomonas sp. EMN2]|uniref:hypothetical protein n=1 Tax=Pseudomonas sp. EMN2 TaxID=2615212 RepID=UPI00129B54DD|nr:hypothetical protein [Pseudomonas sp. EMN2]
MVAIDPNQTADKLIAQRASASAGYKGAAVRVANGKIGLCTSTYNHSQDDATKSEIARRVAALWNLAVGIPTVELEALDASGFKLRK